MSFLQVQLSCHLDQNQIGPRNGRPKGRTDQTSMTTHLVLVKSEIQ